MVPSHEVKDFEAAITPETRMIYVESPTNPLLNTLPLKEIAELGNATTASRSSITHSPPP
jgi:cystathionine beta-lyase/cystathionine gamma-synthase